MKLAQLSDFNLFDFGNSLSFGGLLLTNGHQTVIIPIPEERDTIKENPVTILDVTPEEFDTIIKQTDLLETEVTDNNHKIVVRKSQRQIDAILTWKVFQRDNYTCRYCGITGVPMTFDHVLLWEKGGPTTEENGVTACKKCNKTRGNMEYADWLNSNYYRKVSQEVEPSILKQNEELVSVLVSGKIKPQKFKRSR